MAVREAVEQSILVAVGAASITRERAESIVAELVRRGQLSQEDARAVVDRVTSRVKGEGDPTAGIKARAGAAAGGALRVTGVAPRGEVEELGRRVAELEHRVKLLEVATGTAPGSAAGAVEDGGA